MSRFQYRNPCFRILLFNSVAVEQIDGLVDDQRDKRNKLIRKALISYRGFFFTRYPSCLKGPVWVGLVKFFFFFHFPPPFITCARGSQRKVPSLAGMCVHCVVACMYQAALRSAESNSENSIQMEPKQIDFLDNIPLCLDCVMAQLRIVLEVQKYDSYNKRLCLFSEGPNQMVGNSDCLSVLDHHTGAAFRRGRPRTYVRRYIAFPSSLATVGFGK